MLKKSYLSSLVIIYLFLFIWTGCAIKSSSSESYVGNWRYEVPEMPEDNTGLLVIGKTDIGFSCTAITDGGTEQPFDNVEIKDNVFSATYETQGFEVSVVGKFEGSKLSGTVSAADFEASFSAVRE